MPLVKSLHEPIQTDWTPLTLFTRLKSLKLKVAGRPDVHLHDTLTNMRNLTQLHIELDDIYGNNTSGDSCTLDFISPLTALKSLSLGVSWWNWFEPDLPYALNRMTQLTRLHIKNALCSLPVQQLTQMVDLKIRTRQMQSSDLFDVLQRMTRLEILNITNEERRLTLPSSLFRRLQHLKRLSLVELIVELDFFSALATLSGLTELHFVSSDEEELDADAFRLQVNHLSTLRVLRIHVGAAYVSPIEYIFEGHLPRLRKIWSHYVDGGEEEKNELCRRLPCLNRICYSC